MAKFVKLESGAIVNISQIVAIKYDPINEALKGVNKKW